jgi:hypothetical protein
MWLCLNDGFFSVVRSTDPKFPDKLCVRARSREHIETVFPNHEVLDTPQRDYPCRVFVTSEELSDLMLKRIGEIDYTNFKDSVREKSLSRSYMDIWGTMYEYGVEKALQGTGRFYEFKKDWNAWPSGPSVVVRGKRK